MTKEEYTAIVSVQVEIAQLGATLGVLANGVGDDDATSAFDACASLARHIAATIDRCPGFLEAQVRA